jgi:uncharacterized protein (DUF1330 family)
MIRCDAPLRDRFERHVGTTAGIRGKTMKTRYALVLAAATFGLGAIAVQTLHAQSRPPVYLVGEVEVSNAEAYSKQYSPKVQASVKAAGGRVIALGAAPKNLTTLEGAPAKRVFIQVWDSREQLQAWFDGDDYKAAREIGDRYATFRHFVVEGVPQ